MHAHALMHDTVAEGPAPRHLFRKKRRWYGGGGLAACAAARESEL